MKTKTQKAMMAAMLVALICISTMIIKVPSPFKGYVNLGDGIVLLTGWIMSPFYGFLAAGIGSALADMFSGYTVYIPATFLIKGLMAVTVHYSFIYLQRKIKNTPSRIVSGIFAEILMVLGYFLFEGALYGFLPSALNILPNIMQGVFGVIIAVLLIKMFEKHKNML